jgi:Ser/Thr protein kinase RdoA (MazF antagonist)
MTSTPTETVYAPHAVPRDLRTFAQHNVGLVAEVVECSGPVGRSRVWRLTNRQGDRWYLKQHPSVKMHSREVAAYAQWTIALGPGRAPQLRAADPALSAIVVSPVPGEVVHGRSPRGADEREVHRQLGALLRSFHCAAPGRPAAAGCPSLGEVERKLATARPHLRRGDEVLIREFASRLITLVPLPHVPTHGDAQLRNALWDDRRRQLALIDFERAAYAPAVRDMIRLEYGCWDHRPDLREAFYEGYGRVLTAMETEALHAMAALDALSGIAWGPGAGDREVVERAYRTLTRLRVNI